MAAVLGLAALIFAGGTFAVFLAPKAPVQSFPGVAFDPSASPGFGTFLLGTPSQLTDASATPWFPDASPTLDLFTLPPTLGVTLPPVTPTEPGQATPRASRSPRPTATSTPTDNPTPDSKPNAKVKWTQDGESVVFKDKSTGNPVSWHWTFENGVPPISNQQDQTVVFPGYGQYNVTLTVTDENGDQDTWHEKVRLDPPATPQPTESPTASPTTEPPATANPALS